MDAVRLKTQTFSALPWFCCMPLSKIDCEVLQNGGYPPQSWKYSLSVGHHPVKSLSNMAVSGWIEAVQRLGHDVFSRF